MSEPTLLDTISKLLDEKLAPIQSNLADLKSSITDIRVELKKLKASIDHVATDVALHAQILDIIAERVGVTIKYEEVTKN